LPAPLPALLRALAASCCFENSVLLSHQAGQIDGESISIIQAPDIGTREMGGLGVESLLEISIKQLLTTVQGARESLLLFVQDLLDIINTSTDLGEEITLDVISESICEYQILRM
jgi:hypothetical protein